MVNFPSQLHPTLEHALRAWHAGVASRLSDSVWVAVYFPTALVPSASQPVKKTLCASWPPTPALSVQPIVHDQREDVIRGGVVSAEPEMRDWLTVGAAEFVRVSIPAHAYQTTDFVVLSAEPIGAKLVSILAADTLGLYPQLRNGLRAQFSPLNARESMVLGSAFAGETANETAERTGITLRNVHAYLHSAKTKLGSPSKLAAIQWAHWLGHF